ncbi:hypothetical protein GCM10027413_05450 [Conyzicola nivalis]
MTAPPRGRRELLSALIDGSMSSSEAARALQTFGWDAEPLVCLRSVDVVRMLGRFTAGTISATAVQHWAESIESREDISFDTQSTGGVLFELANPALEGELTVVSARRMIARLSTSAE